jgi:hypothetical protein
LHAIRKDRIDRAQRDELRPERRDAIGRQQLIVGYQRAAFELCLGNEHAVERIAVMARQRRCGLCMFE